MLKIKNMKNVKINNYLCNGGYELTVAEIIDCIKNLSYDDITIDDFNNFEIEGYSEIIRTFIYQDGYGRINININEILY